jgi:hypothetical protein
MVVIIMLEQRVVGVVGLEAAGSRIRMPSSTAPGAWLGHEPGDTKGQQRSQADSRDLAMTSANALEQQRSRRHAVYGMQGVKARIGLPVPGWPIGPWSRGTGAPKPSATGRDRKTLPRRVRGLPTTRWLLRAGLTQRPS